MNDIVGQFQISLPAGWQGQLPRQPIMTDAEKMQFVLGLGEWNIRNETGGPFSAAVFCRETHRLISIGVNRVVPQHCSLAHAEALALALAQQRLQTHDLSQTGSGNYELFASGQPCVQCFGMVWWSGISRLVIGAKASDIEELTGFCEGPLPDAWQTKLQQRDPLSPIEVVKDVCRDTARSLLKAYSEGGGTNYSPGQQ